MREGVIGFWTNLLRQQKGTIFTILDALRKFSRRQKSLAAVR